MKETISGEHGIVVNFQAFHTNYYDAYRYATKQDLDYVTSVGHPILTNSPQTKLASRKRKSPMQTDPPVNPLAMPKIKKQSLDLLTVYERR